MNIGREVNLSEPDDNLEIDREEMLGVMKAAEESASRKVSKDYMKLPELVIGNYPVLLQNLLNPSKAVAKARVVKIPNLI